MNICVDNGYQKLTFFTAATGALAGEININFTPTPVPVGMRLQASARMAHEEGWKKIQEYAAGAASPQIITGLTPGQLYEVYCYFRLAVPVTGDQVGDESKTTATSHA